MRQIDMEGIGHFVHSSGKETLNIVVRVALTEAIHTAHMQTALEKAAMRYPNFHSVLASDGKGLAYEPSSEKPLLNIGDAKRKLGSSALHGLPYCVSCDGNALKLSVHHGVTDGYGVTEFVKTLLYYYLIECSNTKLLLNVDKHASGFFVMARRRPAGLLAASQGASTPPWQKRRRRIVYI